MSAQLIGYFKVAVLAVGEGLETSLAQAVALLRDDERRTGERRPDL